MWQSVFVLQMRLQTIHFREDNFACLQKRWVYTANCVPILEMLLCFLREAVLSKAISRE